MSECPNNSLKKGAQARALTEQGRSCKEVVLCCVRECLGCASTGLPEPTCAGGYATGGSTAPVAPKPAPTPVQNMFSELSSDKENENPQKRGDEKKHEDGPKGNYETPKKELKKLGKTRRCRHGRKAGQATRLRRVCGRHLKGAAETATEG